MAGSCSICMYSHPPSSPFLVPLLFRSHMPVLDPGVFLRWGPSSGGLYSAQAPLSAPDPTVGCLGLADRGAGERGGEGSPSARIGLSDGDCTGILVQITRWLSASCAGSRLKRKLSLLPFPMPASPGRIRQGPWQLSAQSKRFCRATTVSVKGDGPACLGRRPEAVPVLDVRPHAGAGHGQGYTRPFGWDPGLDFPSFPGMTPEDRDEGPGVVVPGRF